MSLVGEHFPLTTTANGRAALTLLVQDQVRALASAEWTDLGQKSDIAQLAQAAKLEYAEDNDDHTDGISAIGVAFRDLVGEVFAISVPIPTSRFAGQRAAVIQTLLRLKAKFAPALAG